MRLGFFQQNSRLFTLIFQLGDTVAILVAGKAAYLLRFSQFDTRFPYPFVILGVMVSALVVFKLLDVYGPWRSELVGRELRRLFFVWATVCAIVLVVAFMTKSGERISRLWFAIFFALGMVLLTVIRLGVRLGLRKLRERGVSMRNVLILGAGSLGKRVAVNLAQNSWTGLRVVGYLDDDPSLIGTEIGGLPVLGDLDSVRSRVDLFNSGTETSAQYQSTPRIHQVWAALPMTAGDRIHSILSLLDDSTVDIHIVPDIFNFRLMNHSIDEIAGLPVINVSRSRIVGTAWLFKALEDKIIAALALVVFVPLMTLIGIGIKLTSAGPVFYHQERMTWCGRRFKMIKFRTMPISVEKKSGPVWAGPNEDRATTIGKFLRKFSLDELPQLINVLRGEMSLVGPRPERPHFVVQFRHQIPDYMLKHVMKAGITGWAQVNGWRGRSSLEHRIEHDLYYIKNWSILFDLKILWYTLVKGIMNKNAY